jgi:GTP cyclohydrolase II
MFSNNMEPRMVTRPLSLASQTATHVRIAAIAALPTEFGAFELVGFSPDENGLEHVAIIRGALDGEEDIPVRLHSECLTGDALGSSRCDCRQQLHRSLAELGASERGAVLYLRQEGRGIGLLNKIRAYSLQDDGLDTVDANLALGFADDQRDYTSAAQMIRELGILSVKVKTNNPDKIQQLRENGIPVTERVPHIIAPSPSSAHYLATKRDRCGHLLTH